MSWDSRPLSLGGVEAEVASLVADEREVLEAGVPSPAASARKGDAVLTRCDAHSSSRSRRLARPLWAGVLAGLLLVALVRTVLPTRWLSEEMGSAALSLAETDPDGGAGDRLFCFSVSMTKGYEVKLIRAQYKETASIFGCEKWIVFSMESFPLGPGVKTVAIPGAPARWVPNNNAGVSVFNTRVFLRAWGKIREGGLHNQSDWTVKSDVDAVFLPARLKQEFRKDDWAWVTKWGGAAFIKNCYKWNSMQGPLEILSRAAVTKLLDEWDVCKQTISIEDSGEDQFLDKCLEQLGLQGVGAFNLMKDYYCDSMPKPCDCSNGPEASVFHPCKSQKSYFECQRQALGIKSSEAGEELVSGGVRGTQQRG